MKRSAVVVCAILFVVPAHSHAQQGDLTPIEASDRADALLKEGIALGNERKWPESRKKLEEAWSLKKSYDIAANLALVEDELGDHAAAATHLEYAIRTFPTSGKPEHRTTLSEQFRMIRAKVGSLRIQLDVEGVSVLVDGIEVGRSPLATEVFVEPGSRVVEARKQGYKPLRRPVTAEPGKSQAFRLELEKDDKTVTPPPADEKPVWPTVLLASVGIASLGTGIGLTIGSSLKYDEAEELSQTCTPNPAACRSQGQTAIDDADLLQNVGFAMFGVTAAAAAGLAIYLALPTSTDSNAQISPVLAPGLAGLHLQTSF